MRGNHPPACTCVSCEARRTGHRSGRQVWRGRDITPGRPPPGNRSHGSGNVGRPPVSTARAPGPTTPVRASKGVGKGLVAVLFLLGIVVGGGGVWWWSTQERESFDEATETVQRIAPSISIPVAPPAQSTTPTPTPVPMIVPAAPPPTPAPTLTEVAAPTPEPEPTATAVPTPAGPPTPTLNAMQIMMLVDSGKISKEEAVVMLERLKGGAGNQAIPDASGSASATVEEKPTHSQATATVSSGVASPDRMHLEEKQYMLGLINAERAKAGAGTVVLGDNIAAQLHADSALQNCFSGHWGLDGLKPYMRYSLAGGYQSNGENGLGNHFCVKSSDGFASKRGIKQEISRGMAGWMGSPGHRRNILNPSHKKVNIGLAWDSYNVAFYQHFEGDYVEYDQLPSIHEEVLTLSGSTKNGARIDRNEELQVQIYYDPPPSSLTRGQLSKTSCYDNGLPVGSIRWPLTGNWRWNEHQFSKTIRPCLDPRDVPSDSVPPKPSAFYLRPPTPPSSPRVVTVPWITATKFTVTGNSFYVQANISQVLSKRGDGVYSIMVWGMIDGERGVISEHSIFHGVIPPDTYDPGR